MQLTCVAQKRLYLSSLKFGWQLSQILYRSVYQQSIKKTASGLMFNFKSILLPELLRILFWTCIGALAVSLLALIIAGVYLRHKLVHGSQKQKFLFYSLLYMCGWVFVLIYSLPKRTKKVTENSLYLYKYQCQES